MPNMQGFQSNQNMQNSQGQIQTEQSGQNSQINNQNGSTQQRHALPNMQPYFYQGNPYFSVYPQFAYPQMQRGNLHNFNTLNMNLPQLENEVKKEM